MADLTRREFAALTAAAAVAPFAQATLAGAAAITADDVIARIKKHIGVEWKPDSVDGIKAGTASTIATGVVTTSIATMAVLQQAVKARANIIITTSPTFHARSDATAPPAGRGAAPQPAMPPNPVFTAKNDFIAKHKLVVFRLSEHWQQRRPDPRVQGLAAALGWAKHQSAGAPEHVNVAALRLDALASHVNKALRSRGGMRVMGNPQNVVQRIGLLPGTTPIQAALKMLPGVDVIVAGEVREWETVEYVRDKVFAGEKKGLVLIGRLVSEEPGMEVCANWLKTFVTEVPVRHISAGDPYWRPAA